MEKTRDENSLKNENPDQGVTLVFMAAGMGKRFGGNKQLADIGPRGQSLMAYTAYDAVKIGYRRLIFILREGMEKEFMKGLGDNLSKVVSVEIVFQDRSILPEGTEIPEERKKPLGTGHALYCVRHHLNGPFVILNADDLYGRGVLKDLYDELLKGESIVIPGYPVENTLSEKGAVSRGILEVDERGYLVSIKEREKIFKAEDAIFAKVNEEEIELKKDTLVSMNIWGVQKEVLDDLEPVFKAFLLKEDTDLLKDEFYLPEAMDELRKRSGENLKIIKARDQWMGMTYKEDKDDVSAAILQLVETGHYPESLFGE